jgi:hypothetical protein
MTVKVQVNLLVNLDVDLKDFLEDDEVLVGSPEYDNDDEGLDALTEEQLLERYREQLHDGNLSFDDLIEQSSNYSIITELVYEGSHLWTEKLLPSEVSFVNSIVDQIPEANGTREAFVSILQKLAVAR